MREMTSHYGRSPLKNIVSYLPMNLSIFDVENREKSEAKHCINFKKYSRICK